MKDSLLLEKIISDSGYSKTKFASVLDINRTFLFGVLNDTKSISEPMYDTLLSSPLISEENKRLLENKRFSIMLGSEDTFENVLYLMKRIGDFNSSVNKTEHVSVRTRVWNNTFSESSVQYPIGSSSELYEIIGYFCQKLFEHEDPFFYTNFSFEQTRLNDILYTIFYEQEYRPELDFRHFIQKAYGSQRSKVNMYFEALRWSNALLNTYCSETNEGVQAAIFPYYIICNDCVIVFSRHCDKGMVFTDMDTIGYYKENIPDVRDYNEMCMLVKDDIEILGKSDLEIYENVFFLDGDICCGALLDRELCDELAYEDMPNRDYLINMVLQRYSLTYQSCTLDVYHTVNALQTFAKTGEIKSISKKYVKPLCPESRIKIFNKMKEMIENGGPINYRIFDENKLNFENISIDIFRSLLWIFNNFCSNKKAIDNGFYFSIMYLSTGDLLTLFSDMNKYLKNGHCFYADNIMLRILDECILMCQCEIDNKN